VNATYTSSQTLSTFTCPSDPGPTLWNGGPLTLHNYVLNAGNTSFYQTNLPAGCTGGDWRLVDALYLDHAAPMRRPGAPWVMA
jgi:hypothetical protein